MFPVDGVPSLRQMGSPNQGLPQRRNAYRHPQLLRFLERWFAELTTKWLRRGTHRSVTELKDSIQHWVDTWNQNPRPFTWYKTADDILDTLATYCQRISDSGH